MYVYKGGGEEEVCMKLCGEGVGNVMRHTASVPMALAVGKRVEAGVRKCERSCGNA